MFDMDMTKVISVLEDMRRMQAKTVDILQRIDDHLAMLPVCECGEHAIGETWLCPLHGWVTKAMYTVSK